MAIKVFEKEFETKVQCLREAERAVAERREQARLRSLERAATGQGDPIGAYNDAVSIETALEMYGFKEIGSRWLSPNSGSGIPGVVVRDGHIFSHHSGDAGIGRPAGTGIIADAFDLFVHFEHGGDFNRALVAAGDRFTVQDPIKGDIVTINKFNQRQFKRQQDPGQQQAGPEAEAKTKSRFKLIKLSDIEFKNPEWLIKPFIQMDSLNQIFGDPGSLKSFVAIDIAACIATGTDFHGMKVKKGAVTFVAGEAFNGLKMRFQAWSVKHQVSLDDADIFLSPMPVGIGDPDSISEAIKAIDEIVEAAGEPALIVIDTVARNFGPGDENSTKDMSAFVIGCDELKAKYCCAVLLVHHSGHADKARGRGAMALYGALDAEYKAYKDENGILRIENTKAKEFKKPEPMAFIVQEVEIPFEDEDGFPLTSIILDQTEYVAPPQKGNRGRGKNQTLAIQLLSNLYKEHRAKLVRGGYDPDDAKVKLSDWCFECKKNGIDKSAFYRLKNSLVEQGQVKIEQGYVSL